MKRFKARAQKILIILITIVTLSVSIPKPVQADIGGVLISPITALITTVADAFQWVLEWAMLGRPNDLMDQHLKDYPDESVPSGGTKIEITKENDGYLDGALFGLDRINVPDIQYTPENIFSNRIPALDVNFINPSVKAEGDLGEEVEKRNIAQKLQPTIASWYVAIRTLAVVGLLSVLIYLGIRILITSIAAEKAKYKKILLDWLVAVCLIFALHYIMSLILTASETVTALISNSIGGDVYVTIQKDVVNHGLNIIDKIDGESKTIKTNLMGYIRFMVQSTDFTKKAAYLALYIMLVIYNIRFTWTYLKRVVNMAFLTLIAPIVALTYPIDKVGDGKAQAFGLWLREYIFNALLQPLHLLLYIVLLGTARQLAAENPLYAIVALGFILSAEKLLKQMFGFGKAGAGTVGSLGGAAAVTALATKAAMGIGKRPQEHGGASSKIRTQDKFDRQGKNQGANKGFAGFNNSKGIDALEGISLPESDGKNGLPVGNNEEPKGPLGGMPEGELEGTSQRMPERQIEGPLEGIPQGMSEGELEGIPQGMSEGEQEETLQGTPEEIEALKELGPESTPITWRDLYEQDKQARYEAKEQKRISKAQEKELKRMNRQPGDFRRNLGIGAYKTVKGIKSAGKTALYSAARGTLKAVPRVAAGLALGATAGVIGATGGDAEKAVGAAFAGFGVGAASGGSIFEKTVGKSMTPKSIKDSYGAGKYGSAIDARNEKADKAYLKSQAHNEEFEKYFKGKMSKTDFDKATKSYREVGITDTKTIRKALILEQKYKDNNKKGDTDEQIRKKVQNIAQSYDMVSRKAIMGEDKKAEEAALKNIESMLNMKNEQQRRRVSNEILQGYRDFYQVGF